VTEPVDQDQAVPLVLVAGSDGPTTPALVWSWLQQPEDTPPPPEFLLSVAATNRLVLRWLPTPAGPDATWPADHTQGTTILAGRQWRRRNSPSGVETAGAAGPMYVRRSDPDVAMFLGLGEYAPPAVG